MRKIIEYIQEKLIINKHSKLAHNIDINIKGETRFTDEELDMIKDYIKSLPQTPIEVSNNYYGRNSIIHKEWVINIYFNNDNENASYISIEKHTGWHYYKIGYLLHHNFYKNGMDYLEARDESFEKAIEKAKNLPKDVLEKYFDQV